ncbi:hypothetical protein BH20ACT1_BH20ACT1_07910 [soil metagenome]
MTSTRDPVRMARPMERPEASSHSGAEAAVLRSARAIVSGCNVDIAGTSVHLEATDGRRALAMALLLCDLPFHGAPARLKIRFSGQCPPRPSRPPDQVDDDFLIWRGAEELVIRYGEGMGARVRGGRLEVGGDDAHPARAFRQIFPFAITHLLAPLGRFVLHAAGLSQEGASLLVLGGSGAGKSSVVLAGVRAGWRPMSDDLVVVRLGADGPQARGIRRPVAGPSEMVDSAALGARPIPGDLRGRWRVPLEQWASGWHRVAGSLVTAHATTPGSSLDRLDAGRLLEPLLLAFLSLSGPGYVQTWLPVAAALSRSPGWELRHGTEPAQRRAGAERLLGVVRAHLTPEPG